MVSRINAAAEIIDFVSGKLVAPGDERNTYNELIGDEALAIIKSAQSLKEKEIKALSARDSKDFFVRKILIDANGVNFGRLVAFISNYLRVKYNTGHTSRINRDYIVAVINADKIDVSSKLENLHNFKNRAARHILESASPQQLLISSVRRRISRHSSKQNYMSNLLIYPGVDYPKEFEEFERVDIHNLNIARVHGNIRNSKVN